jgi:hypothetical protein
MSNSNFTGRIQRGPIAADILQAHYTTIFNAAIRDKRLSRKARGLLVEILSHRDGWGISMASLVAAGPEGKDAIRTALVELEKHGYLNRRRERDELGRLGDPVYEVTDMPEGLQITVEAPFDTPQHPSPETPRSDPKSENPPLAEGPGKPRSEPRSDFPTLGNPTLGNPPHKKPNSSEDQSLSSDSDVTSAPEPRCEEETERETAPPKDKRADEPTGTEVLPEQRPAPVDAEATRGAETVVEAYIAAASAAGLITDRRDRAAIKRDAAELLAEHPDCTADWLAQRAAEMPAKGWSDLPLHVAKCGKPMRAPERQKLGPPRPGCQTCHGNGFPETEEFAPILPLRPCECRTATAVPA